MSSPNWKPDDSISEKSPGAQERKGVLAVKKALRDAGLGNDDRIITSRDPEALHLRDALRRDTLPPGVLSPHCSITTCPNFALLGFQQWQLPVLLKTDLLMAFVKCGSSWR